LQREQDEQKIAAVIDDLGLCIKQIAAANIFPGDMLHKNFGVTRLGRVIFYDYDEISLMTQPNFRDLPSSDDPYGMDTLSVAPGDVFPQQFEHFILGKKVYKDMLKAFHPELMQPDYWRQLQRQSAAGQVQDFTPFNQAHRFNKEEDSL
jgi:isocitrate dehydrogenase kinase/phosphatase